jgi:hypothetical protein
MPDDKRRNHSFPKQEIKDTSNFCTYCGTYLADWEKVIDHFEPFSYCYDNGKDNLFVSCRECNAIKSNSFFDSLMEARDYILERKLKRGRPIKKEKKPILCRHKYKYKNKSVLKNKKCIFCYKEFNTWRNQQKFCSVNCRNKMQKIKNESIKVGLYKK